VVRGFLSGILVGGLVSALGLGTASLLGEQPAGNTPPDAPQVDAPETAMTDAPEGAAPSVSGPGEGAGPSLGPAPAADAPKSIPGAGEDTPAADTAPPAVPQASGVEGAMGQPEVERDATPDVSADDPVLPNPQAPAPQSPEAENDVRLSTDPGQPPAPVVVEDPENTEDSDPAAVVVDEPEEAPVPVEIVDPDTGGDAPAPDSSAPGDEPQPAATDARPSADDSPQFEMQGETNSLLEDRDTGVAVNRPTGESGDEGDAQAAAPPVPALRAHAAPAPNPDDLPAMAIVLVDDGSMEAGPALVSGVPFPVTVAIDPAATGAAERLSAYRAAGIEAAVLGRLPEGATPQDVEVALEGTFADLSRTVALLDLGDGPAGNRAATEQMMQVLSEAGRGYLSISQGLNTAARLAERAGVPAATIYRDLDGEGQDAQVIRRFIEQAAFRARQDSGVVLLGRMRPDTVTALINWGNDKRADQVAQVPLSAVLRGDE